jgi:hypothetical protein
MSGMVVAAAVLVSLAVPALVVVALVAISGLAGTPVMPFKMMRHQQEAEPQAVAFH